MKLAICITAFNGLELLEKCIWNFYQHVDAVFICYQEVSHKGRRDASVSEKINSIQTSIEPFSFPRQEHHKIWVVKYDPIVEFGVKENERQKHNIMIHNARRLGCSHFIMGATDHFYKPEELIWAKNFVEQEGFDVTFTSMYTYFKKPTWRLTPIEDYRMPFICKLTEETHIRQVPKDQYPEYVDPSVKVWPISKHYTFHEQEVMLHHFSMVREDIKESKFKDAVSPVWTPGLMEKYIEEWKNYDIENNPGVEYFKGRKIEVVPNYFNINIGL